MIGIIDYGAGNLHSVKKALQALGLSARIVTTPDELNGVDKMVLPGVGHFQRAVDTLKKQALFPPIQEWLAAGRPFLGICLGMQLLFSESEESRDETRGFSIFPGRVLRFQGKKSLHMGWNRLKWKQKPEFLKDQPEEDYFYFVHRYYAAPEDPSGILAYSEFTHPFAAVVQRGKILGVQFHPEKSGNAGLRFFQTWGQPC